LAEWLDRWLEIKKHQVRQRTWETYKQYCERIIKPKLGFVPLGELTTQAVNLAYGMMLGKYARSTVQKAHTILRGALGDAVRQGEREIQPARGTHVPREDPGGLGSEVGPERLRYGQESQLKKFNETAKSKAGLDDCMFFRVAAVPGMRRSELMGLKWDCVHF